MTKRQKNYAEAREQGTANSAATVRDRVVIAGGLVSRGRTRFLFVQALLIPGLAFAAPKDSPRKKKSTSPPGAILTVQGETIEANEIWLPHMTALEQRAKSSSAADLNAFIARESVQLITDKIAEVLLFQKAKLRLTDPMEKKIDEYVDAEIRKRVTADFGGIQRRMERELERQGWSFDGYRTHLRRSIVISTYLDDVLRPRVPEPTRAELLTAFQENAGTLHKPPRRSMSLIDVRHSAFLPKGGEATPDQKSEARVLARARIAEAQAELRNGTPFPDVARKYSMDSKALDGGAWGFVNPESIQDRFAPALSRLETLQQGEVSEIIELPDGFFIVRCDVFEPGVTPQFVTVQPQLREMLFARAYNKQIAELVMQLRKSATIEPENLESFHAAVVASAMQSISGSASRG